MSAPDWEEAMGWWKNQPEPIKTMIRNVAVSIFTAHAGEGQGCGSSDTNHTVYGMYQSFKCHEQCCNDLKIPVDIIEFLMDEAEGL